MKKHFLLIIILVTTCINLFAQNKVWYKDLMFRSNEPQAYYNGSLFTGIVVEWIGEGYRETNYINGYPNGKMNSFYKNGKLSSESQVKFGKTQLSFPWIYNVGLLKEYNDLGEITLSEEYFLNGKIKKRLDFVYKDSTNGKRKTILTKNISNISNGIYEIREYHESNGKLKEIYKVYHSGYSMDKYTQFGLYRSYYDNGNIKEEGNLNNNGLNVGIWKYYFENGRIETIGLWSINRFTNYKDKEWKWFYQNGNLKEKGSYKNSQAYDNEFKNGNWQEFYENGKLNSSRNYINNQLEGYYIKYGEDGTIIEKEKYFDGRRVEILINNIEDEFIISKVFKLFIEKKCKKIDLKSIKKEKEFTEKIFGNGYKIFYNLELDAEEDTHFLIFYTINSKVAYKFYIKNFDYSFEGSQFFFTLDDFEYDKNGGCKTLIYEIRLNLEDGFIKFSVEKKREYNFCAG
jgi:antitoxin component YwqK of YwqJK toxin-antitoxin module